MSLLELLRRCSKPDVNMLYLRLVSRVSLSEILRQKIQNRELSWYVNMKDIICEQGCSEIENRTLASEVIVKASWGTNQPLTFPHRQIQFTLPNPFVICNVSESVPKTAKLSKCILSLLSSGPAANM